ncbi:MAG: iron-sulfur cluster assembly protein [Phycisphaerales bacterium]|jgi:hypothetical protein|nr:iron-sulfur cluster assembly protein [Phycisphaerales bacterium]
MICSENTIRTRLESMQHPRQQGDVVTTGFVDTVKCDGGHVRVVLAEPDGEAFEHEALAGAIRRELTMLDGVDQVTVTWPRPEATGQQDDIAAGIPLPVLTETETAMHAAGIAPEAGYGECGPERLPSPEADLPDERWEGWPPVFQWDIDPHDSTIESGEASVRIGEWQYEIWFQKHPEALWYVAIQALQDDTATDGPQRPHPMGRNVVVNLVFDFRRNAVVSVYGTARDFRPFIEAFRMGCGLEETSQVHTESQEETEA